MSVLGMNNNNDISITGLINIKADEIDTLSITGVDSFTLNGEDLQTTLDDLQSQIDDNESHIDDNADAIASLEANKAGKSEMNTFTNNNIFNGNIDCNGIFTVKYRNYTNADNHFQHAFSINSATNTTNGNYLNVLTRSIPEGNYNPSSKSDDIVMYYYKNAGNGGGALNITCWNDLKSGIRLTPSLTEMNSDVSFNNNINLASDKTFNGIPTSKIENLIYLDISSSLQASLNSKAGLTLNNSMSGDNIFTKRIQQTLGTSLNTSFGLSSLNNFTETNTESSAFGYRALSSSNSSSYNTAIGSQSLGRLTIGNSNTALGQFSGNSVSTGSNNIFIGKSSGLAVATESNNICIGNNSNITVGNINSISIGSNVTTTSSNQIKLGTSTHNISIDGTINNKLASYYDPTSSIQNQLNSKESSSSTNFNAERIANGTVSNTEFQYLDGVTSSIQQQINSKLNVSVVGNTLTYNHTTSSIGDSIMTTYVTGLSFVPGAMYIGFGTLTITKNLLEYDSNGQISLSWNATNYTTILNNTSTIFYTSSSSNMRNISIAYPTIYFIPANIYAACDPKLYFEYYDLNNGSISISITFIRLS